MKRLHDSLDQVFRNNRLVFWYDGDKEWDGVFESFERAGVEKLCLESNAFGTKVRILEGAGPEAKFLVYSSAARPADGDNWLLDLVLQGHEFKADRASLALQEVGLPYDFRGLAEQHVGFFKRSENTARLKELLG